MKLDYIKANKKPISIALSGISVLCAVLVSMKIISFVKLSAKASDIESLIQTMKEEDNTKPDDLNKYLSLTKEMASSLKKSNLFAPPQPKRNPITEISSILGNEVWINNKWYKEGEMCQDAKIVTIEATQVTIEWDGKTTVLRPLDAAMASSGSGERPPSGGGNTPPPSSGRVMTAPPPQVQPPGMVEMK